MPSISTYPFMASRPFAFDTALRSSPRVFVWCICPIVGDLHNVDVVDELCMRTHARGASSIYTSHCSQAVYSSEDVDPGSDEAWCDSVAHVFYAGALFSCVKWLLALYRWSFVPGVCPFQCNLRGQFVSGHSRCHSDQETQESSMCDRRMSITEMVPTLENAC